MDIWHIWTFFQKTKPLNCKVTKEKAGALEKLPDVVSISQTFKYRFIGGYRMTNPSACLNATIKLVGITYTRAVIKLVLKSFRRQHSIDCSVARVVSSLYCSARPERETLCHCYRELTLFLLKAKIVRICTDYRGCAANRDVANLCCKLENCVKRESQIDFQLGLMHPNVWQ